MSGPQMYQHPWLCSNTNWVQKLYIDVEGERVKLPFHTQSTCSLPADAGGRHSTGQSQWCRSCSSLHEDLPVWIGIVRLLNTTSKFFGLPFRSSHDVGAIPGRRWQGLLWGTLSMLWYLLCTHVQTTWSMRNRGGIPPVVTECSV